MAELRRDPVIGRWVIVSTDNSLGPESYEKEDHTFKQAEVCQFCPGREYQTPPEVDCVREHGSHPNGPGWSVRVVPNKFPALRIEGDLDKRAIGLFDMSNGVGAHEVVIETPDHAKILADLSPQEIVYVIKKFQSRYINLAQDRRFKYIMIFKNYGESAGASVEHPHSQIIALPMIPRYVYEELEGARNYYKFRGRCVYCDMIQQEYEEQKRIVTENNDFIAFCPFTPRFPFENWIFPKKHHLKFEGLSEQEQYHLASILKEMLYRLKICLSDPSYNFYLHLAPVNYESQESFHWHIEIVPQLTRIIGFEWGTGLYYVQTAPFKAAEYLREVSYKI